MKRAISFLIILLVFSCHLRNSEDISAIASLPDFHMLLVDSTILQSNKQIPSGNPIVLVYFRPSCPHCQAETKAIIKNISALKDVNIYMLAGAPLASIKEYYYSNHLDQFKNIKMGKDIDHSFAKVFKPRAVPYMAVYDIEKNLIRIYYGEVNINVLINATKIV